MGLWRRLGLPGRRSQSLIAVERKILRFRRLVEQHGELLDLFADLKEKQSGEYILDRQYIEARLDRAYEGARRILYDMQVLSGSDLVEGYDQVDRLRSESERILRNAQTESAPAGCPPQEEEVDWETLALQALLQDLTRLSPHNAGVGGGTETDPDSPGSLSEWAWWGHRMAAEWLTEHLIRVSPTPLADLCRETTREPLVRIFLLGSARESEEALHQCLAPERRDHRAEGHPLLPLRIFLQGLCGRRDEGEARQVRLEKGGKQGAGGSDARLELYADEDLLLLRLPRTLPLRLFWCSLSLQARENLFYLYGTPLPSHPQGATPRAFSSEKEPFCTYRGGIGDRWVYWASNFSRTQGVERIRMLGHSLSVGTTPLRGYGPDDDPGERLQEGIARFLKQAAIPQREG